MFSEGTQANYREDAKAGGKIDEVGTKGIQL
jgi:hypothetical protein